MRRFQRSRSRRGGRGQSPAEVALPVPIVVVILLAIFDLGRLIFAYNDIGNAARQGARTAIIDQAPNHARDRVIQMATGVDLDPSKVDVTYIKSDGTACPSPKTLACQAV